MSATRRSDAFETVKAIALAMPDVQVATRYDGSPVLQVNGVFMAGLTKHPSAEPDTLVVRADPEARQWLLEDAPETYYTTDYHRPYPVVLVRLSCIDRDALRDLLTTSWRVTVAKTRPRTRVPGRRATESSAFAPDAFYGGAKAHKARGRQGTGS